MEAAIAGGRGGGGGSEESLGCEKEGEICGVCDEDINMRATSRFDFLLCISCFSFFSFSCIHLFFGVFCRFVLVFVFTSISLIPMSFN